MASIARQSPLLRQTGLSAIRSPLVSRNAVGASQLVAFHASAKKQILPPLPRELDPGSGVMIVGGGFGGGGIYPVGNWSSERGKGRG